jgi:hypothetical protein
MKTIISTPRYQLDDNHGAAAYGGFELVDTAAIPPHTMAIAMNEDDAHLIQRVLNHQLDAKEKALLEAGLRLLQLHIEQGRVLPNAVRTLFGNQLWSAERAIDPLCAKINDGTPD